MHVVTSQGVAIVRCCSWYLIAPVLSLCVTEATSGCVVGQQEDWEAIVTQINETMYQPDCSSQYIRIHDVKPLLE